MNNVCSRLRVIAAELRELTLDDESPLRVTFDFGRKDREEATAVYNIKVRPSDGDFIRSFKETLRVDLSGTGLK